MEPPPTIEVRDLTMAYGAFVVLRGVSFAVRAGEIKAVAGESGCGKSTLFRHLVGLERAASGEIRYSGERLDPSADSMARFRRRMGVLFQSGALWSSMTVAENVALPLEHETRMSSARIREAVRFKLALVGLSGVERQYPSELSGGMRKRAGLARAMALDPEILFFDEPSAGLDPVTSRRLDDLILDLRDALGTTVVIVTHELASIFAVADTALFLDGREKRLLADGDPRALRDDPRAPERVRAFLNRDHADDGEANPLDTNNQSADAGREP